MISRYTRKRDKALFLLGVGLGIFLIPIIVIVCAINEFVHRNELR